VHFGGRPCLSECSPDHLHLNHHYLYLTRLSLQTNFPTAIALHVQLHHHLLIRETFHSFNHHFSISRIQFLTQPLLPYRQPDNASSTTELFLLSCRPERRISTRSQQSPRFSKQLQPDSIFVACRTHLTALGHLFVYPAFICLIYTSHADSASAQTHQHPIKPA